MTWGASPPPTSPLNTRLQKGGLGYSYRLDNLDICKDMGLPSLCLDIRGALYQFLKGELVLLRKDNLVLLQKGELGMFLCSFYHIKKLKKRGGGSSQKLSLSDFPPLRTEFSNFYFSLQSIMLLLVAVRVWHIEPTRWGRGYIMRCPFGISSAVIFIVGVMCWLTAVTVIVFPAFTTDVETFSFITWPAHS